MEFISYPKITAPFKRDMDGSKKLIPYEWANEELATLKGMIWEWTEKIDGTNIQIRWDGYRVEFGGRTTRSETPQYILDFLEETFGGPENEQIFEQMFGDRKVVLFGECYGPKIGGMGKRYGDEIRFAGFDALTLDEETGYKLWMKRQAVEDICKAFGVRVAPIMLYGTIESACKYVKQPRPSEIAEGDAPMEGLVGRPPCDLLTRRGGRIITKVKYHDMKELDL